MWWIRAMRLIEGTTVHRINHITRINRAIPWALRIKNRLRTRFHTSPGQPATGHQRGPESAGTRG